MKSGIICTIAIIMPLLWGSRVLAQPENAVVLTDQQEQYSLGLHLELLEDPNEEWTIDDVTSPDVASRFVPSSEAVPSFGFTDSAYWVRFQVRNDAGGDTDWILLYESLAFHIDAYFRSSNDEGFDVIETGTILPFETRDIPTGQFAFRLPVTPGESETIYLRFASEGTLILPLRILEETTFYEQVQQQEVTHGILYGILFILVVYNFILSAVLKDGSYLFYVLFFSATLLAVMALDGFAAQYLWPGLGFLAATSTRLFFVLATIFALLFAMSFLHTREYAPRLNVVMSALVIANLAVLGLMYVWFGETGLVQALLLIVSCITMIVAGTAIWRKGYTPARYYLLGWVGIVFGFVVFFLTLANIVPFAEMTNLIFRVGLIVLALVWSIAIASRINLYRQEKIEAQLAVSEQRAAIAQDLHDSVTQSLYSANLFAEAGRETLEAGDEQGASHYFKRIGQTTQQALKEMRLFLYELRPPDVVETGLVDALQQRIDAVEKRSGVEARLLLDGFASFSPEVSDQYYRIAQEALNNVLKHAEADKVTVYLRDHDGIAVLEIVDNGRGFDLPESERSGGMGLGTMRERAKRIGGQFVINTAPGQGTSVKVEVAKNDR